MKRIKQIIRESIKQVLIENEYTKQGVWDLVEELKQYMDSDDILSRLIARLDPRQVVEILKEIKAIEIGDEEEIY